MAYQNYSQKLLNPRWQRRRLEVLNRDNFTCQHCGDDKNTLHVHHLIYLKFTEPWEYEDEFLITLCLRCHKVEEDYRDQLFEMIKGMTLGFGTVKPVLQGLINDFHKPKSHA